MKILILGARGTLGGELNRQLKESHEVFAYDREELDVTDRDMVIKVISDLKPEVIFNCVAYNAVDKAEEEKEIAEKLNTLAPGYIAEAAEKVGATLVHYSTNFVFDGLSDHPYTEDDIPNPVSVYGMTKYEGEKRVFENCLRSYVVRLSVLFGPQGDGEGAKKTFPDLVMENAPKDGKMQMVEDEINSPTYAVDLAKSSMRLISEGYPYGVYHLANEGSASWYDLAKEIIMLKGMTTQIEPISAKMFDRPAKRPPYAALASTKFKDLRPWQEALREFLIK